jgi:decaprenylphospho-beta-D-erythro-pentofuranosid-2-ulose 2-reductase
VTSVKADRGAIVVLGATSGIARAVAEIWCARGESLVLAGRDPEALAVLAKDLAVLHGGEPAVLHWDLADFESHPERVAALTAAHDIGGVFVAAGVLHMPEDCAADPARLVETFQVNLTGPALACDLLAAHLRRRPGGGFVSVLTSVAGDRGRGSNYQYGASKAGLSAFLEGLRARMAREGAPVLVQDIKAGPVNTRMTARFRKGLLLAEPASAAAAMVKALDARREVVYVPGYWRPIMAVIRALPRFLFKRLPL